MHSGARVLRQVVRLVFVHGGQLGGLVLRIAHLLWISLFNLAILRLFIDVVMALIRLEWLLLLFLLFLQILLGFPEDLAQVLSLHLCVA